MSWKEAMPHIFQIFDYYESERNSNGVVSEILEKFGHHHNKIDVKSETNKEEMRRLLEIMGNIIDILKSGKLFVERRYVYRDKFSSNGQFSDQMHMINLYYYYVEEIGYEHANFRSVLERYDMVDNMKHVEKISDTIMNIVHFLECYDIYFELLPE